MAASKSWQPELHLARFLAARSALNDRLCVALSGGRDSVALLHAAARLGQLRELRALHVHHGLSPNADQWADFCAELCAALGVALTVARVDVERHSADGLEAAARRARYAAFAQCEADGLLLAHHQDDQAETVLFNLLRGSGVAGAAGMAPERRHGGLRLMRPWLDLPAAAIADYARANDLRWVEDESNADQTLTRNYLRHSVMAAVRGRFDGAAALAGAAAHFREADLLLAQLAELDWRGCCDGESARMSALRQLDPARLKNLLRWRLRQLGWRVPGAGRLEEFVRQLLQAGPDRHPAMDLPDGGMVVRQRALHWLPRDPGANPEGGA